MENEASKDEKRHKVTKDRRCGQCGVLWSQHDVDSPDHAWRSPSLADIRAGKYPGFAEEDKP